MLFGAKFIGGSQYVMGGRCRTDVLGSVTGVGKIAQERCKRNGYRSMLNEEFYPQCLFFIITGVYGTEE